MQGLRLGSWYKVWGKRCCDVVLGSLLALIALPLIVVLSLTSMLAFRAWPIFVQPRIGREGRLFRCLKIRSLPKSAPRAADKHAINSVETNAFGRFIRRTHLDEFPQLFLVPLGHMSLVGPRPEMPELLDRYPAELREARKQVRPGCTGLWQISDAAIGMIYESSEYDTYYVDHVSIELDLRILGRTLRMLTSGGSEHLSLFRRPVSPDDLRSSAAEPCSTSGSAAGRAFADSAAKPESRKAESAT